MNDPWSFAPAALAANPLILQVSARLVDQWGTESAHHVVAAVQRMRALGDEDGAAIWLAIYHHVTAHFTTPDSCAAIH